MAKMVFKKNSREWNIMSDFYRLCQDYWIPEPLQKDNPDDYWGQLIKAADAFARKYDGSIFAMNLAMSLLDTKNQESQEAKEIG